jgi:hypothetical protein
MSHRCSLLVASFVLLGTAALSGQVPRATPKPGPEHQNLNFFQGRWRSEGEMKAGPMGPGGKVSGMSTCEWFAGGFHLVCRSEGRGPTGNMAATWIMGYSNEKKRYTYYGVDNSGMDGGQAFGLLAGDTWTWTGESTMSGQQINGRYTVQQLSPDSWTWKYEVAVGPGPFTVIGTGTETRIR